MKVRILFLMGVFIFSLAACKKKSVSNHSTVCVNEIHLNEEKYLSSVFESKIIQLETIDESLIGRKINKICKRDNKYYISYDNVALVIFDSQGKFLRRINRIGGGPGDYTLLVDFDVLPDGNIIIQDAKKMLFFSNTGEYIKSIQLGMTCYNIKVIDEDNFLVCASGEEYSIYLINKDGNILSKQIKTNNIPVLGRSVTFYRFGDNTIYQQDLSNDFLSFNTSTNEFIGMNLLCDKDNVLSIEIVNDYKKRENRFNSFDYVEKNPGIKVINAVSSYADFLLFSLGNSSTGFKFYIMNTSKNTISHILSENTVDDICFNHNLLSPLLFRTTVSDSDDCLITYLHPYQIIDNFNKNTEFNEHTNYKHLLSLFKNIQDIENENPVLIELRK